MKIIVLSSYSYICKVNNYGSLLQYFALQTFLERRGYQVQWLQYEARESNSNKLYKWLKKNLLHSNYETIEIRHHNPKEFSSFISRYINLTEEKFTTKEALYSAPPKADLYIVGSDQIWNGYSSDRFLMFIPKTTPKISYAVSFGKKDIPLYMKPLLWYYLRTFKAISIREKEGVQLCLSLGYKDAVHTIDPSFLLSKEDYINIIKQDNSINLIPSSSYIYGYFVNSFPNNILTAKSAIDKYITKSKKEFYVTGIQNAEYALTEYKIIQPSPLEWINTILNADCILTNSFHGVAFSINLQKPFLLILQTNKKTSNQNCRYLNLLKELGLESRIYDCSKNNISEQMSEPIDWDKVNQQKRKFILDSENFLLNAISPKTY